MPSFDIESFKSNFEGGARSYLFYFLPRFPVVFEDMNNDKTTYLVKSTNLPSTTSEDVVVNWQGYDFKMAGKYTFEDFTVTFNVDTDAKIIQLFSKWMTLIHNPETNEYKKISEYMAISPQRLVLLDYEGNSTVQYLLHYAYPKTIGQISLDYSANEVATFEVTFAYQYHTIIKGGEL